MTHRFKIRALAALLCAGLLLSGCGKDKVKTARLDPNNPVTVTVWHYYNGTQQEAFDQLVTEFNHTEGLDQGIIVEASSLGSVVDLQTSVLDSANKKVGAAEMPNIFAAYADTAYAVDGLGLAADLNPYFTKDELNEYVDGYIEEGRFGTDDSLKIFPIAKSTEIFMLNKTDWDAFAKATGAELSQCETIEGVTELAEQYYNWTDSQTEKPDDGKAFFGRDAIANYFLIGAEQLGMELFAQKDGKPALHFDEDIVRKLWDNYYVPFVRGYFAANGRFRSDDVKTGKVISFVGSSSGATFFPSSVIIDDDHQYPIEVEVLPAPQFEGGQPTAVQQGAGMVVTQAEESEEYASVLFLKWFTDKQRNSKFSIESGYLPVKKEANDIEYIREQGATSDGDIVDRIVSVAIDTVNGNKLYTPKAFANGTEARNVLEYAITDAAEAAAAEVQKLVDAGTPRAQAAARFTTDERFEEWYQATKTELEALVQ